MRNICISVPSGKAKMILWEGTEDEKAFEIKSLKCGIPYVMAYGVKYDLTEEEISYLQCMQKALQQKKEEEHENKDCLKCKDCKYFRKEKISRSRSGVCVHEKWKNGPWGDTSPLMGCNTHACNLFKKY